MYKILQVEDKIIKVSIEKFDTLYAGDYSATFKFKEREPHTEVILSLSLGKLNNGNNYFNVYK